MTEPKKNRRFLRGLLLYVAFFLLLAGAALLLLDSYLATYEATRPATALAAYRQSLVENGPDEAVAAALSDLDNSFRPREEDLSFAAELLLNAEYPENVTESSQDEKVYAVRSEDGIPLGTLRFAHGGKSRFGLTGWELKEEQFDFSAYTTSTEVNVPAGYSVLLDGTKLGRSAISDSSVPYEVFEEISEAVDELPVMVRYESGRYLGTAALEILDEKGAPVPPERQNELSYLDNCSPEEQAELESFAEDFVERYVNFTANIGMTWGDSYAWLRWLVMPGSALGARLQRAATDGWWSNTRSCTLQDLDIHLMSRLREDLYFIDLSYETRTVAFADPVVERYNVRLLVEPYGDRLVASALHNYSISSESEID